MNPELKKQTDRTSAINVKTDRITKGYKEMEKALENFQMALIHLEEAENSFKISDVKQVFGIRKLVTTILWKFKAKSLTNPVFQLEQILNNFGKRYEEICQQIKQEP